MIEKVCSQINVARGKLLSTSAGMLFPELITYHFDKFFMMEYTLVVCILVLGAELK